ncbi:MAG TPA: molybdenum cofactor biosynthesis protein MoaE [Thermoanaerobaculia bacterium]|nr:molybdenum cofactor biosynthesis protein MoaE [Thermoanaerobaculia bacterium]
MRVRLLAFASAADALGAGETEIELPEGADVGRLRSELERRHPEIGPLWSRLAVAVDGEIAGLGTALREGAEVALLPPVSGGLPGGRAAGVAGPAGPAGAAIVAEPPPRLRAALTEEPIRDEEVIAAVSAPARGAVLLFLGTVRDRERAAAGSGGEPARPVERLTYSAYRPMAEERLLRIVEEIEAAHLGLALAIVHRLGEVPAGEASVAIAAASPHRPAAYAASREALERLKREVPIWKREHYAGGGARWREEEALDPTPGRASPPPSPPAG